MLKNFLCALLGAMVIAVNFTTPAHACSICGCGDPLMAAGDSMPMAGRLSLGVDTEFLQASATSDDDPTKTESLIQQNIRPLLVFSPTDSFNLVLQVPIVNKNWSITGNDTDAPLGLNQWGLGDIDLGARFFVFQRANVDARSRQSVAVSFGSSLPTGNNNAQVTLDDGTSERIDEHAQLGTGALGPYAGLLYAFHQDPWNVSFNIYGRVHTVNSFGYSFGNAAMGGLQLQYKFFEWFGLGLACEGRYADKDDSLGVLQDNTGGTVIDLSPSLQVRIMEGLWLSARVQAPVYINFFGTQTTRPTTLISMKYDIF